MDIRKSNGRWYVEDCWMTTAVSTPMPLSTSS